MNLNEIKSITKWAEALGLSAADLQRIKTFFGFDNNAFINYLNRCFSYGEVIL